MQRALALSAELIAELQAADVLLICPPMYNFTVPAVLKSWIDYVVRPGFAFRLAPGWPGMLAWNPGRWPSEPDQQHGYRQGHHGG